MENKFETGRILIKTEIQGSPSCNQIGQGKKKKSIKSEPILGGICKEEKFYTSRPSPWRVIRSSHNLGIIVPQSCAKELPLSCLLENALRQMEELQKPRLCSQGMCLY